jgi:hypothetical protein
MGAEVCMVAGTVGFPLDLGAAQILNEFLRGFLRQCFEAHLR